MAQGRSSESQLSHLLSKNIDDLKHMQANNPSPIFNYFNSGFSNELQSINSFLLLVDNFLTNGANKSEILTCTRQNSGEMTLMITPSLPARVSMVADSLIRTSIFGRNLRVFCSGTTGSSSSIALKQKIILKD